MNATSAVVSGNTVGFNADGIRTNAISTIEDNYIGTDLVGADLGNFGPGIELTSTATSSTIRKNTIGFNTDGIYSAAKITVENNYIGTNSFGADLGNLDEGIELDASDGPSTITLNTVAANAGDGILVTGATVLISQNNIGTNATSDLGLGNGGTGVLVDTTADAGSIITENTIALNSGRGILAEVGSTISDNYIGTDSLGTTGLVLEQQDSVITVKAYELPAEQLVRR